MSAFELSKVEGLYWFRRGFRNYGSHPWTRATLKAGNLNINADEKFALAA
jgi:hypothetical protein